MKFQLGQDRRGVESGDVHLERCDTRLFVGSNVKNQNHAAASRVDRIRSLSIVDIGLQEATVPQVSLDQVCIVSQRLFRSAGSGFQEIKSRLYFVLRQDAGLRACDFDSYRADSQLTFYDKPHFDGPGRISRHSGANLDANRGNEFRFVEIFERIMDANG